MPAFVLGVHGAAYQTRLLRSAMLDVLSQDYLRTARAKGLLEQAVIVRHGLRNALIPVITASGVQFAVLMGGAVIVETVFAWPGVGSLAVSAINNRDVALVVSRHLRVRGLHPDRQSAGRPLLRAGRPARSAGLMAANEVALPVEAVATRRPSARALAQ